VLYQPSPPHNENGFTEELILQVFENMNLRTAEPQNKEPQNIEVKNGVEDPAHPCELTPFSER
jgi:hypothetical protein